MHFLLGNIISTTFPGSSPAVSPQLDMPEIPHLGGDLIRCQNHLDWLLDQVVLAFFFHAQVLIHPNRPIFQWVSCYIHPPWFSFSHKSKAKSPSTSASFHCAFRFKSILMPTQEYGFLSFLFFFKIITQHKHKSSI